MFNFRSTSELENFQNLILKYASKGNLYKPPAYRARNELAALGHNAPYTSFCSIYVKAINIYRQFTFYKNICYHYTKEIDLIVPSLFVTTARPQCALWPRAANSFLFHWFWTNVNVEIWGWDFTRRFTLQIW
jgi:hypothetical protein